MSTAIDPKILAAEFVEEMRRELNESELIAVDYANTFGGMDANSCASHDFRDANEIMLSALAETLGITEEHAAAIITAEGSDGDAARQQWGRAWDIAKEQGFSLLWTNRQELGDENLKLLSTFLADTSILTSDKYPPVVFMKSYAEYAEMVKLIGSRMDNLDDHLPDLVTRLQGVIQGNEPSSDTDAPLEALRDFVASIPEAPKFP